MGKHNRRAGDANRRQCSEASSVVIMAHFLYNSRSLPKQELLINTLRLGQNGIRRHFQMEFLNENV